MDTIERVQHRAVGLVHGFGMQPHKERLMNEDDELNVTEG